MQPSARSACSATAYLSNSYASPASSPLQAKNVHVYRARAESLWLFYLRGLRNLLWFLEHFVRGDAHEIRSAFYIQSSLRYCQVCS